MGKALVIFGADFSANGILVNKTALDADWDVKGFVYSNDNKGYSDPSFSLKAFYLSAGDEIVYSLEQGSSSSAVNYGRVSVGVIAGHVASPALTNKGVSLGTVTPITTISSGTRYPAIPKTTYTANSNVTFFIGSNNGDTVLVTTEVE